MRKNLFLTCALALFAIVGVSAQDWCRTLATGLPGKQITHDVNGTSVTQYRAETALIKNAGATGVRYTVLQTSTGNQIKGGGPCFALGEMIVLDAAGDTIGYTVTSNADHNTMGGAGNDGAGMPALNDGDLGNYFHSTWSAQAPNELHYIELTFEKSLDEFQLVWYTRPNQHVNRPQVVGLTNPGVTFTEDMLFAEYEFEAGGEVTDASEFANGGTFTLYVEGEEDLSSYGDYTGNGSTYIALSGYTTGKYDNATVTNLVQFIPAQGGKFILYQPVLGTYYANPDRWTDGYNGANGWLRAYSEGWSLAQFEITERADGDFEITTELTRQYVDGAWKKFDEPLKVWVGYDSRGNLKIFPQNVKEALEQKDYAQGFGLPVDFGFTIFNASASKEMVPDLTADQMCESILKSTINLAEDKLEEYADVLLDYDWEEAEQNLNDVLDAAKKAVDNGDLAAAFEEKSKLEAAIAKLVAQKANYYEELHGELVMELEGNVATPPYTEDMTGMYTQASVELLGQVKELFDNVINSRNPADGTYNMTYSQMEANYAQIESLLDSLEGTMLAFTKFPAIVEDIPADNFPYADLPNNAVWKKNLVLTKKTNGIRLTFLDRHIGSAGDGGNFPMIAIGELKIYDGDGNEVTMAAENFYANHTETNEGFESTVARLCDGNFAAQGYYHSPWSGNEPQEYIYIDITFPESMAMDNFTFEVYSRDKSTSQGKVSLFPKKVAITAVGEAYDPLLFAENPYNVDVDDEKVTAVDQLTDGIYVIKGLLNTQAVWKEVTEGEGEGAVTRIQEVEPDGTAMFYHNTTTRFHNAAAAVREASVFRITKNADGTYTMLNLAQANYWPTTEGEAGDRTGFVAGTYDQAKAAKLNIVPSTNIEGAFVMYEKVDGLTTEIAAEEEGGEPTVYNTPYVVYMDWHSGLATRPVTDPQPVKTSAELADNWGDAQCFNKANGEGEWEIYKVTMDNPDFCWLTGLVSIVDGLGIVVGDDPGCVSNLGALETVLPDAQKVIAESEYDKAAAAAAALAKEISAVTSLEKNPMVEGVYQIVSANPDFKAKQNVEKAIYAYVDEAGAQTFGWKTIEQDNNQFYFHFTKSEQGADLEAAGTVEDGDLVYNIKAIATYEGATEYYVGEIDAQSTPVELFSDFPSDYLVLNATGSAFNFRLAGKGAGFSLHANQHGSGSGQNGNLVYWDGDAGASQWYLRKVDSETSIDDLVTEGTEVVSVAYYTTAGAAIPAPAKGINIVVTTYANGVVEAKKVLVK